ncbi:class I SAM-dependent methyltransferase [Agromyces mediolanus]|uniref:class I SAM-dependent methyltransferase n=1 Tax=Agromyces mediolanus TaxID=41986 RepID=UPI003832E739
MPQPERPPLVDDDALDELEREWFGRVHGRVLEIGAGEGENFGALALDVVWTGLEPDGPRRAELAIRAREWGHEAAPLAASAERIPVPDGAFDAVIASYVLCTVPDPGAALAEVRRVLVPGGRLVVVEHVGAPRGTVKRTVQRLATPCSVRWCHGCHLDRDTEQTIADAGFRAEEVRRVRAPSLPLGAMPILLFDGVAPA